MCAQYYMYVTTQNNSELTGISVVLFKIMYPSFVIVWTSCLLLVLRGGKSSSNCFQALSLRMELGGACVSWAERTVARQVPGTFCLLAFSPKHIFPKMLWTCNHCFPVQNY